MGYRLWVMGYRLSKGLECMSYCLGVIVLIHYWAAMNNNLKNHNPFDNL